MRSYIKVYGPPVLKAIRALEKIAVDTPTVCIMNTIIAMDLPATLDETQAYFNYMPQEIEEERCSKIISKAEERLGDYDFFLEWFKKPTTDELNELIEKIDNELTPLGCKYTITTKAR